MKRSIAIALAFAPAVLVAQSAERQVIASTGGHVITSTVQVTHTVGESVTATGALSNIIVTQGFQQPAGSAVGIEELDNGLSVAVFPNPVANSLTIEMNTTNELRISATVHDMQGRRTGVSASNLNVNGILKCTLDFSSLHAGQYLISFTDGKTVLGTVRVEKVN